MFGSVFKCKKYDRWGKKEYIYYKFDGIGF